MVLRMRTERNLSASYSMYDAVAKKRATEDPLRLGCN